ncbi:MAG: Gfo/Idh/MocA family oxidoreductase, partial [Pirellulales bacterium]
WPERIDAWKDASPATHICHDLAAALAQPIDAVVVEGAVAENVALAQAAVEAGRSVLLEKPGGPDWQAYERLTKTAARQNAAIQMTYLFRYMAAIEALFQFAQAGHFGHIYEFRGRLPKELSLYTEHEQEFAQFGGGMFFEMGGHLIDFAVHLLGPPSKVHGVLRHDRSMAPQGRASSSKFIDNAVALLEHEAAVSILEVTALESAPNSRRIEVYGTEGAFVIPHLGSGHMANNATQDYWTWTKGQADWQHHAPAAATLQIRDLREFAAVLRGEKEPEYSAEHDSCVQRTLLEACGMR